MGTADVRIDPKLNKAVWARGIKNVPHRIRVRVDRKRNDEEDAKHKLYCVVSHVPVLSYEGTALCVRCVVLLCVCLGLQNETIEE